MVRIGDSPPRPDGWAKVTGGAKYVDDLTLPGMLHGATLRSPHPRARIVSLRFDPALAPEGAVAVTARDIPGVNGVRLLDDSWPVLADGMVHYVGDAVALVAAPTREAARRALKAFTVEYEPLPPVLTWEEAEGEEPLCTLLLEQGDPDRGFAEAAQIVEGVYHCGHQEHIYIECQGMLAWFEPGGSVEVMGSMQCPFYVHHALAHALGLPEDKVRVRPSVIGGGFGGKEDYPSLIAIHAALLARASRRPVKMVYDRHEDILATTKRHPGRVRLRTGVAGDGRLIAMEIEVDLDGGAFRTLSPVVLSRGVLHATGAYRCPHVKIRGRVLRTNTPPNGAFRGFGAPQTIYAAERHMDRIGRVLGIDPLTLRLANAVGPGDSLATGQVLKADASARLCLDRIEKKTNFRARWLDCERARGARKEGEPLRGIGLSLYLHGSGFTGLGEHRMRSPVTVRLTAEGRIEVLTAMTDIGQGSLAALSLIAADAAGVNLEDITLAPADTSVVPDSGPTVASRTTMVVGGAISRAVAELREQVLRWAQERHGADLRVDEGEVFGARGSLGAFRDLAAQCRVERGPLETTVHYEPPAWQVFDETTYHGTAYATYGWGADVVEVEMDPDTLEVKPRHVTAVCEVGRVIHTRLCRGQIEGGTLQAVAYGYLEEMKTRDGRYLNDRLATYIIPTIQDAPRMDVELLERPWEGGPSGAKGVGELPMDGGAPAVLQAIENATGIFPTDLPATPERLLDWLARGQTVAAIAGDAGRRRRVSRDAGRGGRRARGRGKGEMR